MMKEVFHPGEAVRILTREEMPRTVQFGWCPSMNVYSGSIMMLTEVCRNGRVYFQNMPPSMARWSWSTDMIAHLVDPGKDVEFAHAWLEIMH